MQNKGFTLIELMIVVAIIGILASIAYPSYQDSVRKSRRAIAQSDLMQLASFMERTFTEQNSYDLSGALPDLGTEYYNVDFETNEPTATTFIIEAAPTGSQTADNCATLSISNTGAQGAGSGNCW